MSDHISATLQEGSEAVALAARPSGPEAIRARGDRRRRRNQAGLVLATVAVVAAGAGAYPLARDLSTTAPPANATKGRTVPNVIGTTLPDAEEIIAQSGLRVGHVSRERRPLAAGFVFSTSPRQGSVESRGTSVNIVVSAGSNRVVIPNVTGMAVRQAEAVLREVGLTVEVRSVTSGAAAPGTVLSEQPAAGSLVPSGATVVIGVAPPMPLGS